MRNGFYRWWISFVVILIMGLGLVFAPPVFAQAKDPTHQHPGSTDDLSKELKALKAQVAQLQSQLQTQGSGMSGGMMGQKKKGTSKSMGGMGKSSGMGMMDDMMGPKGMMSTMMGSGGMMGEKMGGMGGSNGNMGMMGQMKGNMLSELPGYPGASHLYHIGATGFFLDHPEHITLSQDQQSRLAKIRDESLLRQNETQRKINEAEEELSQLTASDQPSISKIEGKIREIEKLRSENRLAFIRAVGESTKVLNDGQRQALLGQAPPMGMGQPSSGNMQQGGGMSGGGMMDDQMGSGGTMGGDM